MFSMVDALFFVRFANQELILIMKGCFRAPLNSLRINLGKEPGCKPYRIALDYNFTLILVYIERLS
jgi:hypothetical protein